jgi:flagellar protein FliO/FliZ
VSDSAFTRTLAAALCGLLMLPARAVAADGEGTPLNLDDAAPKAAAEHGASNGGALVRTIVGLAVVIGVIYGITWVLRQVKASREERASGSGLQPLATLPLGPNRALHLVRAGGEVLLVGAGEHGVVPVRTYSEQEARDLGLIGDDDGDEQPPAGPPPGRGGLIPRPRRDWLAELRARTVIR